MGEVSLLGWVIALLRRYFVNRRPTRQCIGTLVIYHLYLTDLQCHHSVQNINKYKLVLTSDYYACYQY